MQITLGFLILTFLILFPGLIYRRFFYFGEFSKQFDANHSLISLLASASIPGIILLLISFFTYDKLITPIDLGAVIDKFKDISNPEYKFQLENDTPIKELLNAKVVPFMLFLYSICLILGIISGRMIRFSGLDIKFKLLRFHNSWFYLITGKHGIFSKIKYIDNLKWLTKIINN